MSFVLASGSASRRAILQNAGLVFDTDPADVDEDALKRGHDGDLSALALRLAEAKALAVSARRPGELVIGADQVLDFEGRLFDKAKSAEEAEERLKMLRGRVHWLKGGIAAARDGVIVWRHVCESRMAMRDFSDDFLARYMLAAGEILTKGVGAYAYEGLGAQLFDSVDGDFYAVLGLPLLPVLTMLREQGAVSR
jgi:septum formation protein